jgi:magnesium transporter
MGRLVRRQRKAPGAAPGTLVHTGERKIEEVRLRVLAYAEDRLEEVEVGTVEEVLAYRDAAPTVWINVDGLHDVSVVERLGDHFGLHPLAQEDIVHVGQRPKAEAYDDHLLLVLGMLAWDRDRVRVSEEQLSLVLGRGWVVTFQERVGDVFEPVRERIRTASRRIRTRGADYLAYALVDAVVDRYFGVVEGIGEVTEARELTVMEDPAPGVMESLHQLKRELLLVRRSVVPVREMVGTVLRSETELVGEETGLFLRDVQDHATQLSDATDTLRDLVSGLMDLHLATVAQRTNEVMKVLTIMASIFIPLTFMAGIYGMNFEWMPELQWRWGYPALLGAMVVVGAAMLAWFRRKGWL